MMDAIVAVYADWGIGDGGTQPVVLQADRVHFKEVTDGAAVIGGRKTLEDFPGGRPLKNRRNIVVTGQNIEIEGAEIAHSVFEALQLTDEKGSCFVIGGASIYEQFFPYTGRVYVTKIGCCPESSRFFPNLDREAGWKCTFEGEELEEKGIKYKFCTYERT